MTYGVPQPGAHEWTLDEEASRPFVRQALEAGFNFFDTANGYSAGTSEEFTGRALKTLVRRDEIVIAAKTFIAWRNAPQHRRPVAQGAVPGDRRQAWSAGH